LPFVHRCVTISLGSLPFMTRSFIVDTATVIALVAAIAVMFLSQDEKQLFVAFATVGIVAVLMAARTAWRVSWLFYARHLVFGNAALEELAIYSPQDLRNVFSALPSGTRDNILRRLSTMSENRRREWATGERKFL